jgi:tetratricopeptide (TPR) repeat protein
MLQSKQDMFQRVAADVAKARELLDGGETEQALALLSKIRGWAASQGIPHTEVTYLLAVGHDNQRAFPEAIDAILAAIEDAPLEPHHWNSFQIIVQRARLALAQGEDDDPSVPEIYAALQRASATSMDSHAAMAAYHWTQGNAGEALRLVEGVLTLAPTHPGASRLRRQIAEATQDEALLAKCKEESFETSAADELRATQPEAKA